MCIILKTIIMVTKAHHIIITFSPLISPDTAMAGVDYVPLTSTLTFDSQSSGRLCGVVALILDDNVAENDEDFTVQLEAGGSTNVLASGNSAIVTIISDDGKPIHCYSCS